MVVAEKLVSSTLDNISKEQWKFCVQYGKKIQDGDFTMEIVRVKIMDKIIINFRNDNDVEVNNGELAQCLIFEVT
jgi:hypothetical protein